MVVAGSLDVASTRVKAFKERSPVKFGSTAAKASVYIDGTVASAGAQVKYQPLEQHNS